MKNFLIIVLALGLTASAFMTRPDQAEFEHYLSKREPDAASKSMSAFDRLFQRKSDKPATASDAVAANGGLEFKDFYLWTVVQKDGKTLYTGVFDHWIDNGAVRDVMPQGSTSGVATATAAAIVSPR